MPELPGSTETALINSVACSRIHWKYLRQVGEYKADPEQLGSGDAVPKLQRKPERRQQVLRALRLGTSARLPYLWACQFSSGSVLFRVRGWSRSKQAGDGTVDRPSSNRAGHSGLLG